MPTPIASEAEMSAFLARAGFILTPEQVAEYVEAYGYIVEMSARIRGERSYMAEPAHIFSFPTEESAR
ncbi:MAG TPA: hypothetical protein VGV17_17770 [Bosea sp. (in: a-proteobacteria)]|jgi:hypothetical protein|uniref:hypothetical protein n=1 Tax=Bosea sp. (in: a-proteobacteria) TaxID=1871050 RepID=UPI002DDC9205|nr:hypothetical protein [Bosea sp. (in: a-proteobacteria)]HEV2555608.1 hypothetical protein [Bosea sp. (in: a-proteobacteria)]